MATSNTSWGIEVGSGGIRAIKLQADGDSIKVLDFLSYDHAKVLTTPELDLDDALRVAVGTLVSRHDLSNSRIAVSLPGHQSFARFAKLPPVEAKKVPDIVKFEAVQQIPFPLADVEWDYQTFVSPDSPEVEVGIFAITRQRMMERLNLLADVGITPDVATLSPIAAYNSFAYDLEFTENTVGTILLDIGTQATDLVIAHSGRVWVRTFPIGGHQFTEALVEQFKLPYSKAEKLKRDAEQTKHARHVFQAMRPVFTDLVQEVQRSIGYYQSLHPQADLKRLIGIGATFRLPGLRKFLKQQLQIDVYRLEQFKRINVDGPRAGEFQTASLNLATAYGLALQGLGIATLEANLMPVKMIRNAMWKRKVAWFGAAAAVAAAASAAMFIRPVMDNNAITAAGTPTQFDAAIREADGAKSRAMNAGVLTSEGEAAAAEQMIGLFDASEVYGHIVSDVGQIIARAHEAARAELPAGQLLFHLDRITTDYRAPEGAAGSSDMGGGWNEPGMDYMGGDEWSIMPQAIPGRSAAPSQTAQSDEPDEVKSLRRVRVQVVLNTTHPAPQDFEIEVIEQWLAANKTRNGVPYTIVAVEEPGRFDRITTAPQTGFQPGPRSPFPGSQGIPTEMIPDARRPVNAPDQFMIDDRGNPDPGQRTDIDLERVAPIAPQPNEIPRYTSQFTLVFYAVLDPMPGGGQS
ncbi:MAG: type IV pilus assembly protein PilM [Phycisphaeraceae bacterium]|nr:type IV pilus assembly protein PilM [Phycisphaeraceae bacterium]MCW5763914.1 type IV pilus assembly protein PilM [Phycisphaeraceae bacterium]